MAAFKVVAAVPLPLEYQTLECSKYENWFVWPKRNDKKSKKNPNF